MIKDVSFKQKRETFQLTNTTIGVFLTLEPPSKDMTTEAVTAGFYESPHWKKCPRLQILTISDLLKSAKVDMPPKHGTFKQAQRVRSEAEAEQVELFE
jgi:site-specific DNA-methyltransferase (adenine-specific)